MLRAQPKVKPIRSKKYRVFVQKHKCCKCGGNYGVVPHHPYTGGTSTKCCDTLTVPLCFWCHESIGRKDAVPGLEGIIAALQGEWERLNPIRLAADP